MKTNQNKNRVNIKTVLILSLIIISATGLNSQNIKKTSSSNSSEMSTESNNSSKKNSEFNNSQGTQQQDQEKLKWINEHPEEYKQLGGKINNEPTKTVRKVSQNNEITVIENRAPEYTPLPEYENFPKYYNTGNKTVDDENYRKEKNKWIEQNRSVYKTLNKTEIINGTNSRIKPNNNN